MEIWKHIVTFITACAYVMGFIVNGVMIVLTAVMIVLTAVIACLGGWMFYLGWQTEMGAVMLLGAAIVLVHIVGCYGFAWRNDSALLVFTLCMLALQAVSLLFLFRPDVLEPIISKTLEQYLFAIYINEGDLSWDKLPCCPTKAFVRSWGEALVMTAGCAAAILVGKLPCEFVIDALLISRGPFIAIAVLLGAMVAGILALTRKVVPFARSEDRNLNVIVVPLIDN